MKRIPITIALSLLLVICFVQGAENPEVKVLTSTIYQGETAQAKIVINNLVGSITQKNIIIRNEQSQNIPMSVFLTPFDALTTYVTFDIPLDLPTGTYSFVANKVNIKDKGLIVERTTNVTFQVGASQYALSFLPGVIVRTKETKLSVKLTNRGNMTGVIVDTPEFIEHPYSAETTMTSGSSRQFSFTLNEALFNQKITKNDTQFDLGFSYGGRRYTVPVLLNWLEEEPTTEESSMPMSNSLMFTNNLTSLKRNITKSQILQGDITIFNRGEIAQENVTIELTGNLKDIVTISPTMIYVLEPNRTAPITLIVNEATSPLITRYVGLLRASNSGSKAEIQMEFIIVAEKNASSQTTNQTIEAASRQEGGNVSDIGLEFIKEVSIEPRQEEKRISYGAYVFVVFFIIGLTIYLLRRKRMVKETTFENYVDDIERKKR